MTTTVRDGLPEHPDTLKLRHSRDSGSHFDEAEVDGVLIPARQVNDVLYFTRLPNPRYAAMPTICWTWPVSVRQLARLRAAEPN